MAARGRDCDAAVVSKTDENYEDMEEKEGVEDEDGLPVVVQCKNCSSILGDSTAWVCANDDLKTVTLQSITSAVTTRKKLMTSSSEGTDLGSTYVHLLCKQCNEVVGRIYKTTPKQLDSLRDLYTFSVHQIKSYQVGSRETTADTDLKRIMDIPTAKSLREITLKTQGIICALSNRVLNIENALGIKDRTEEFIDLPDEETETQEMYEPPENQQNASDYTGSMKQAVGQCKTIAPQNDVVSAGESSGSLPNGRKYGSGKRSKELPAVDRANKRSRCK